MRALSLAVGALLVGFTSNAHAQSPSQAHVVDARAQRLFDVRAANAAQDEPQGYLLLSWGLSSVATGAVLGATGLGGETARWFGVNTAVWGAINTAIAIPWVLSFSRERRAMDAGLRRTGPLLESLHREVLGRSNHQAMVYGINAAIDVLYVTAGAVAWWAGTQQPQGTFGSDFLLGTGIAAVSQGAFLLAFDTIGWLLARGRSHRIETVWEDRTTR